MAIYNDPQPKVGVDETFRKRLEDLRKYAAAAAVATSLGQPDNWFRPTGGGSPQDIGGIGESFSRRSLGEKFVETVEDPNNAGTVADMSLVQMQGDFLACMERAYRARHHSACRDRAHAAGRLRGHGHQYGVFNQGLLRYVQAVDFANRSEEA